jgi:hypothetical protein
MLSLLSMVKKSEKNYLPGKAGGTGKEEMGLKNNLWRSK